MVFASKPQQPYEPCATSEDWEDETVTRTDRKARTSWWRYSLVLVGLVMVVVSVWNVTHQEMSESDLDSLVPDTTDSTSTTPLKDESDIVKEEDDESSLRGSDLPTSSTKETHTNSQTATSTKEGLKEVVFSAETVGTHNPDVASTTEETPKRKFIDFAVVGFEKCGTTFLLENVFNLSPQVFMAGGDRGVELHELEKDQIGELYENFEPHLHERTSDGAPVKMGFKNPTVLNNKEYLRNMQDNFPRTKMIVTMRHPILWFQSWYNYKLRTGHRDYPMPTPHQTIGLCRDACKHKGPEGRCIPVKQSPGCSGHANFHQFLSRLNFTKKDTEEELHLLEHTQIESFSFPHNKVFITEIGQMDGKNLTVSNGLMRSMEDFLGLRPNALPDIKAYQQQNYTWAPDRLENSVDICDSEYDDIRVRLLDQGRKAGQWIEEYFMKSPQVVVFDEQDFLRRIRHWKVDPCLSR